MPVFNFDLEDGKPKVSFTLKQEDAERFMAFMDECHAAKARMEWLELLSIKLTTRAGALMTAARPFADAFEAVRSLRIGSPGEEQELIDHNEVPPRGTNSGHWRRLAKVVAEIDAELKAQEKQEGPADE